MTISTQKDLAKLIKLCRSLGVESIKVDNIEFHLGFLPTKISKNTRNTTKQYISDTFGEVNETTKIETPDELTEEQMMMWSVGATIEN